MKYIQSDLLVQREGKRGKATLKNLHEIKANMNTNQHACACVLGILQINILLNHGCKL